MALLSPNTGKSCYTKGYGLDRLVGMSSDLKISPQTQKRTVGQVAHFMDWAVYEGHLASNPFSTVRVEAKGKAKSYAAMNDEEVRRLLAIVDPQIDDVLAFCLLSGMRAGEAAGLLRDDLIWKGNLGWFA